MSKNFVIVALFSCIYILHVNAGSCLSLLSKQRKYVREEESISTEQPHERTSTEQLQIARDAFLDKNVLSKEQEDSLVTHIKMITFDDYMQWVSSSGNTGLHLAVRSGSLSATKAILDRFTKSQEKSRSIVEQKNNNHKTPMIIAKEAAQNAVYSGESLIVRQTIYQTLRDYYQENSI